MGDDLLAAQSLGAIAVGFNSWWVAREVAYGIDHTTPTVVIADAKRAQILSELNTDVPVLTMEEDLPTLMEKYSGSALPRTSVNEDDPAVILYTSGTSGRPKGAVHSHRNVLAVIDYHRYSDRLAAAFTGKPSDGRPSDLRYLLTAPLFHIASLHNLAIPRLATGGAVVIHQAPSTSTKSFPSSNARRSPTGRSYPPWQPVSSSTAVSRSTT